MVSTTFFGCLRASEVIYLSTDSYDGSRHLTLEDITVQHREVHLRIKYSKADQTGHRRRKMLQVVGADNRVARIARTNFLTTPTLLSDHADFFALSGL